MSTCMWAKPYKYAEKLPDKTGYQPTDKVVHEDDPELTTELESIEARLETVDENGAPLYSKRAFDRTRAFLMAQSARAKKMYGHFFPVPDIGPGPEGSFDLHWKTSKCELLINISPDKPAVFYGDDYGIRKIKGSLNPDTWDLGIILWLMKDQIISE